MMFFFLHSSKHTQMHEAGAPGKVETEEEGVLVEDKLEFAYE